MKFSTGTLSLLLLCGAMALSVQASRKDAYDRSRIFWDSSTQKTIFSIGNYARVIQLQDGRLMAVCENAGINVIYSSDNGSSWSPATKIVSNPANVSECVPDLIQLSDGTIVVGYNPRPHSPYSEDRRFGIRAVRSTDNGATWSSEIFIFDAKHTFSDGCWEPSFLELPSGELQCYFANEAEYTTNNDQCISMCRSFDKGITWSAPVKVSYRAGTRDGMPVPILTKDKSEIVVIVEDNGWPGSNGFMATTVRTALTDNWESGFVPAGSDKRSKIFATAPAAIHTSGAPYLRMLPSGETVASYQGNDGRGSVDMEHFNMSVLVGDEHARNFKGLTQPFRIASTYHSLWNSVAVVDTGVVMAVGSIGIVGSANRIDIIKGYPRKNIIANFGTPTVDGSISGETWSYPKAQQIIMGHQNNTKRTFDFLYDDNYLYFTARCVDRDIFTDKADNDGVFLYIDMKNACDVYPRDGMYQFFFNLDGSVQMKHGEDVEGYDAGKWKASDASVAGEVIYKLSVASLYYELEAAIPWSVLGVEKAPVGSLMRADVSVRNRRDAAIEYETIVDTETTTNKPNSWAWMGFVLMPSTGGVDDADADSRTLRVATPGNGMIAVTADDDIAEASFHTFDGVLRARATGGGAYCELDACGSVGGVLSVRLADGSIVTRKVMLR